MTVPSKDAIPFRALRVLSVGGTIDKVYFDALSEFKVGDPQVLPVFTDAHVDFPYVVEGLMRKDSLDMTDADRALVREHVLAAPETHVLVTHGTDTMTDTAAALAGIPGKVVMLTGAMRPSRHRDSDAFFNLGCAVGALQALPPGVYIAMNGRVFRADRVRKNREKGRFEEA